MTGVLFSLTLVVMMLWRWAYYARRWERDCAIWNAYSGCQMSTSEYKQWIESRYT
jgi:hypothetical protein